MYDMKHIPQHDRIMYININIKIYFLYMESFHTTCTDVWSYNIVCTSSWWLNGTGAVAAKGTQKKRKENSPTKSISVNPYTLDAAIQSLANQLI